MRLSSTLLILVSLLLLGSLGVANAQPHITARADFAGRGARPVLAKLAESHSGAGADPMFLNPLSSKVAPLSLEDIGIQTQFPYQSNGRALHNIQIDPDDPNKIHVVIVGTLSMDPSDTVNWSYPSRRCFYTFSSDGGATWRTPVVFGKTKTGYPDMQLIRRNGKNVPIIAAHRWETSNLSGNIHSGIWIERGNPGDGNFGEYLATRRASDGMDKDLIWPALALSKDGSKAYIVAAAAQNVNTGGTLEQLEFGSFTIMSDSATFDGWTAEPGSGSFSSPGAGLTSGGEYRIRVSDSGTIGVMWKNDDYMTPDVSIYFVESRDSGKNWSSTVDPLVPVGDTLASNPDYALTPIESGLDFYYDGETPVFVWMSDYMSSIPNNYSYLPTSGSIFFQRGVSGTPVIVVSNVLDSAKQTAPFALNYTSMSQIDPQGTTIDRPTIARTSDPKVFRMYYQVLDEGDSSDVGFVNGIETYYMFASLYYQETSDGGQTWGVPVALRLASSTTPELDYRQPSTSDFNTLNMGLMDSRVLYIADELPGWMVQAGLPSYSTQHVQHIAMAFPPQPKGAVQPAINSSAAQSGLYPNPFSTKAMFEFQLSTSGHVTITLEDILGRAISTLQDGEMGAGDHTIMIDGERLPGGVYRLSSSREGSIESRTLVHVR